MPKKVLPKKKPARKPAKKPKGGYRPTREKSNANPHKRPPPDTDLDNEVTQATNQAVSKAKAEVNKRKDVKSPRYWVREQAGLIYITSPDPPSLRKMAADKQWGVKLPTLEKWSIQDQWIKRRNEFFDAIGDKVRAQISKKLVKGRIEALETMTGIFETTLTEFGKTDDEGNLILQAKSFEGMVSALVRLAGYIEDLRDKIVEKAIPEDLGGSSSVQSSETSLTEEEARYVARALMQKRQEARQIESKASDVKTVD